MSYVVIWRLGNGDCVVICCFKENRCFTCGLDRGNVRFCFRSGRDGNFNELCCDLGN